MHEAATRGCAEGRNQEENGGNDDGGAAPAEGAVPIDVVPMAKCDSNMNDEDVLSQATAQQRRPLPDSSGG